MDHVREVGGEGAVPAGGEGLNCELCGSRQDPGAGAADHSAGERTGAHRDGESEIRWGRSPGTQQPFRYGKGEAFTKKQKKLPKGGRDQTRLPLLQLPPIPLLDLNFQFLSVHRLLP